MPPYVPFAPLTFEPEAAIDLQMHTTFSDGHWTATHLLDHVAGEGFALVAITDHDRLDTVEELQRLAAACGVRVLPAVEMSSTWQGDYCDVLCFGVHPGPSDLAAIADTTHRRQEENVRAVYAALSRAGYQFPRAGEVLAERGGEPHQFDDLVDLMEAHSYTEGIGRALKDAGAELGAEFITADLGAIVEAAHASGALALIAHPGRGDGFARFDAAQLDRLRAAIPIDGLEARHPTHTPEQIEDFLAYARRHRLLVSAGSDSHGPPGVLPIKHPAASCRDLLARLGIELH
jgi:predicted metal-dependent phosphoesterase TrpH